MTDFAAPYAEAQDRLLALVDGRSYEDLNRKPSATSWSAAECVVHLNKVSKLYLPTFEALVEEAPAGGGPYRWGLVARWFIEGVRPGSRAVPTLGGVKPPEAAGARSEIDVDRALERFRTDTARYLAVCAAAEGKDVSAVRMRSPILPLLKLPLGAFLEAMGLHSLRHVLQAERAVAAGRLA